ncbi:peptidase inhibitor family I36 protein [Thermostaphylospora chromogena]|uniref:Peptidase inhibitor family I36 n=1 Tax=Thermostaphylospora chromogena TaxID=35622 RepID=A0A1H1GHH2_9ACTN|nr:peptidase inhibitor family I36 protein [Thermostaphylospora chromogena]SDR12286.1 hypothetical protein SAMN04489764_3577 [Thermostaphylospora chromogena]
MSHASGILNGRRRLARATVVGAALLAALAAPRAEASTAPADPEEDNLPPGVIRLLPGEECPQNILCLWLDHERGSTGYGISEGYPVHLADLPCGEACGDGEVRHSMEDNASSWWNRSRHVVKLVDLETGEVRYLRPGKSLEETADSDNTADMVRWIRLRH